MTDRNERGLGAIPWFVWVAGAAMALLRSLPFLQSLLVSCPGFESLPVGFIPKDWFAYAGMVRRVGEDGLFLSNPFTTDPQGGRFILLFHQVLGAIHSATGVDPLILLEASRWPVTILFAVVLWRFLATIFSDRVHARWAFLLVMFSGGLEYPFVVAMQHLADAGIGPVWVWRQAVQDMWHLYGWNTYQAAFNPLWLCGLTGILWFGGVMASGERPGPKRVALAAAAFVVLWYVHSYSAVAIAGIACGVAVARWVREWRFPTVMVLDWLKLFAPGLVIAGLVSLWQSADPVFKASAGGFFGTQAPSMFWMPLTLGVPGVLAVRGWMTGGPERGRDLVAGWTVAAVLMAVSTMINGYHFVYLIHIPVCIAAAPVVARVISRSRAALIVLCVLLFASTAFSTFQAGRDVGGLSEVPVDAMAIVRDLADEQPGNVLAPPELGNIIPAFGPHKVWVGQWFMTPGYQDRAAKYRAWFGSVDGPSKYRAEIMATLASGHIRWLVVPTALAPSMTDVLSGIPFSVRQSGSLSLIVIGGDQS
ncbi:MAG TPA: hypothetical protein PKG98_12475 [Myxococcota bacterium]|nr:hypothetical protein [Myxococcota bacterium]